MLLVSFRNRNTIVIEKGKRKVKCGICGRICKTLLSLSVHLTKSHRDVDKKQYYDAFIKTMDEGICMICGNPTCFVDFRRRYDKYCVECNSQRNRGKGLLCGICGQSCANFQSLHTHIRKHQISDKEYYDTYLKKPNEGICSVCGKPTQFLGIRGYKKNCIQHKYSGLLSPAAKKAYRNTCLEKYGVESTNQSEEINKKRKHTMMIRYGVENAFQSKESFEKYRTTMMKRYGVSSPMQSELLKDKYRINYLQNNGYENPQQNPDVHRKSWKKYKYNDELFDSSWELALYIWCIDGGIPITREPVALEYFDVNNHKRVYFPDFQIWDSLCEVKGTHLVNDSGELINPKTKTVDEEKTRCMRENKVYVMRYDECKPFIDYCIVKFKNKKWFKQFEYRK